MNLLSKISIVLITLVLLLGIAWIYYGNKEETEQSNERISLIKNSLTGNPSGSHDLLVASGNLEDLSTEELILTTELSLELPDRSFNYQALEELRSRAPEMDLVKTFNACVLILEGEIQKGISQLRRISIENPSDPISRYYFLKNLWIFGRTDDRIIAKTGLFELGESKDRWGYKSLQVLNFSYRGDGLLASDSLSAIERLQNHPLVTSLDYINSNERKVGLLNDYSPQDAFDESSKELGRKVNPVDLGFWSLSKGFVEDALDIVPLSLAKSQKDAFWVRFSGLIEINASSEANLLYKDLRDDLSPHENLRARAYLSLAENGQINFNDWLTKAKNLNDANSLLDFARLALVKGNASVAYEAFQEAWNLNERLFHLSQANQFLQISLASRNTRLAHRITESLAVRFPNKFGNANNHCYLSLLLEVKIEEMEKLAEKNLQAFPTNRSFISTLALAKLKTGKPLEALRVMNRRGITSLLQGERALLAIVLKATGKDEVASTVANGLAEKKMLPEEWELLKEYGLVNSKG